MKREITHLTDIQQEMLHVRLVRRAGALVDEIDESLHSRGGRDAIELAEVEAAIARIEAGTYGLCADCGSPLSFARLDAVPEAPRCVRCETARETCAPVPATL